MHTVSSRRKLANNYSYYTAKNHNLALARGRAMNGFPKQRVHNHLLQISIINIEIIGNTLHVENIQYYSMLPILTTQATIVNVHLVVHIHLPKQHIQTSSTEIIHILIIYSLYAHLQLCIYIPAMHVYVIQEEGIERKLNPPRQLTSKTSLPMLSNHIFVMPFHSVGSQVSLGSVQNIPNHTETCI